MIEERKVLLQNKFYSNFPKIIFGAKSYLKPKEISNLFDISEDWKIIELGEIGEKRKRMIKAFKWKKGNQTIISCDQLSGSAGWSDEAIEELVENIKN